MPNDTRTCEVLVYPLRRSLYVNVTNSCSASCVFCPRESRPVVGGHDLSLHRDPTPKEYVAALERHLGQDSWQEVVFCGFGEPTLRLDVIHTVARRAKQAGLKVRLNTNGHGSLIHGRLITLRLRGLVDVVSVSLNADNPKDYNAICRPSHAEAFPAVLSFIHEAQINLPEVQVTAVEGVPGVNLDGVRELAESIGAKFVVRPLAHFD